MKEQSTIQYIHHFRGLALAIAPGHESTSRLREQCLVNSVKWWQAHLQIYWPVYSENGDKCTELTDGKHTYRSINMHSQSRASKYNMRSKTLNSPSIWWTSRRPANTQMSWHVKQFWSMLGQCNLASKAVPNVRKKDCQIATEWILKEIENAHQAYWLVYVHGITKNSQDNYQEISPRSHSNGYRCQRISHEH